MTATWLQPVQQALGAVVAAVLRVLLLGLGLLMGLAALSLGLLLSLALITWALLRGHKPVLRAQAFRWRGTSPRGRSAPPLDVVDIDAREVSPDAVAQSTRIER
jgi:hypothetical protein